MTDADRGWVGVVGSGTMRSGIAQVFAQAGYRVRLSDVRQELLDRGMEGIKASLARFVARGAISGDVRDGVLSQIFLAVGLAETGSCGLVVEAVTESENLKIELFR